MIRTKQNKKQRGIGGGYTIIELVVSVGLFMVVVLISGAAFFGVVSSNRKTLAIRTAIDNLNSAMESMSRNMQTGSSYHCETIPPTGPIDTTPKDCSGGGAYIAFEGQNGDSANPNDQIIYQFGPGACPYLNQICVSTNGGATFFALTAPPPELSIDGLAFRVYGSEPNDVPELKQPRITMVIIGSVGDGSTKTTFDIETTVSQRLPDFP